MTWLPWRWVKTSPTLEQGVRRDWKDVELHCTPKQRLTSGSVTGKQDPVPFQVKRVACFWTRSQSTGFIHDARVPTCPPVHTCHLISVCFSNFLHTVSTVSLSLSLPVSPSLLPLTLLSSPPLTIIPPSLPALLVLIRNKSNFFESVSRSSSVFCDVVSGVQRNCKVPF